MSREPLVRVTDELARRHNDRTGLLDVQIQHEPSGVQFVCRGSVWDKFSSLQLISDDGLVPASECLLLTEWEVPNSVRNTRGSRTKKGAAKK